MMSERLPPSPRAAYRDWRSIATRWMDNDVYGHMNNAVHYALFDTAINGWLIDHGAIDVSSGKSIGLVVESGCRYFSEIAFPDVVAVGFRVARVGVSSVQYEVGLFRNDAQVAAAEGRFVHVYVDRKTRRPMPIEGSFRQALDKLSISRGDHK